uniref:hypothetical protein n=2 Tax=Moraxellaceae TaxID=468 RepID=UPI003075DA41
MDEVMGKEQYLDFKLPDYTSGGVGTDRSHGLGDARLFSIFIDGRPLDSLTEKEKAFYDHIQSNPNVYDITYSTWSDGGIKTHIGSFDSHLIYNRFILWIPFFVISFISNFVYSMNKGSEFSIIVIIINFLVFGIGLIGVPSTMFKPTFDKDSFKIWYPLLLILSIVVSIFANI